MRGIQVGRLVLHKGTRCQSAWSMTLGRACQKGSQERGILHHCKSASCCAVGTADRGSGRPQCLPHPVVGRHTMRQGVGSSKAR